MILGGACAYEELLSSKRLDSNFVRVLGSCSRMSVGGRRLAFGQHSAFKTLEDMTFFQTQ